MEMGEDLLKDLRWELAEQELRIYNKFREVKERKDITEESKQRVFDRSRRLRQIIKVIDLCESLRPENTTTGGSQ